MSTASSQVAHSSATSNIVRTVLTVSAAALLVGTISSCGGSGTPSRVTSKEPLSEIPDVKDPSDTPDTTIAPGEVYLTYWGTVEPGWVGLQDLWGIKGGTGLASFLFTKQDMRSLGTYKERDSIFDKAAEYEILWRCFGSVYSPERYYKFLYSPDTPGFGTGVIYDRIDNELLPPVTFEYEFDQNAIAEFTVNGQKWQITDYWQSINEKVYDSFHRTDTVTYLREFFADIDQGDQYQCSLADASTFALPTIASKDVSRFRISGWNND